MKIQTLIFLLFAFFIDMKGQAQHSYPVIDAHFHVKTQLSDPYASMEEYFGKNQPINLIYALGLVMTRQGQPDITAQQNDSLFVMEQRNPRFIPVCSVHPYDEDVAIAELERISKLGGKVLKLHPITQQFEILDKRTINLVREAGKRNLIVLIDGYGFLRPAYLDQLMELSLICPPTKFIIAHMGGSDFYKLGSFNFVKKLNPGIFDNVWYDISATVCIYSNSPYADELLWVMRSVGIDRILFGSDNPATTVIESLDALYKLNLTQEEQELILYKNALKLFHLKD